MQSILKRAGPIAEQYRQAERAPDPSFVLQLPDETVTASNLFAVQKLFDGEFEFDVFFESSSASHKLNCNCPDPRALLYADIGPATASTIDQGITALLSSFNSRFEAHFPTSESFAGSDYEGLQTFSKAITSNLLGGIGYFYGNSIVDTGFAYEWDQEDDDGYEDEDETHEGHKGARLTEPQALLTATPSRSFFPRGFYW